MKHVFIVFMVLR